MATSIAINENTLIPDLLRRQPGARQVLDRYGLRGCGGANGPVESLGFFARAHDVPLERLLAEIASASPAATATVTPGSVRSSLADAIYRPFFTAGIATVLTLGAAWGAYLLFQIGSAGTFTAAGLHEVNAHGHAQIFGWVGLSVMGFAYQAFPRFKHTSLANPRLALATLVMLILGLLARSIAQPLVDGRSWLWWIAITGSGLEIVAIGIFVWQIVSTLLRSGKPLIFYDYYIFSALGWFFVQAVYEGIYLTATLSVTGDALIEIVSTWQAPLRDLQIHGFAMLMILGVSQRVFHHFYGLPAPSPRLGLTLLPLLNAAVIGEAAGLILMRQQGPVWAALWYGSVIALTVATAILVGSWRIFSPAPDTDRSLKFLRVAYVWLFISLGMLVLLPAHQIALDWLAPSSVAAQLGFSHAYYGAARHAITVGFVSLMIMGVAAKVVPTLNGVDARTLSPLWLPFVLLNTGCLVRVVGQTLTDLSPLAFPVAGVSGVLEVMALALWGTHLLRIMLGNAFQQPATSAAAMELNSRLIQPTDTVAAVLDHEPELLRSFLLAGFTQLSSPYARRTVARVVTLRQACQRMSVDEDRFVQQLNETRSQLRVVRLPLVALSTYESHGGEHGPPRIH